MALTYLTTYNGRVLAAPMTPTLPSKAHRYYKRKILRNLSSEATPIREREKYHAPKCSGRKTILTAYGNNSVNVPEGSSGSANPSQSNAECVLYQLVISKATMMGSFKTSAVNEMETMFRNSFSNRIKDMIIMADPESTENKPYNPILTSREGPTLIQTDLQPCEKWLVRKHSSLQINVQATENIWCDD